MAINNSSNKPAKFGQRGSNAENFTKMQAGSGIPDRDGSKFRDDLAREAPQLHNSHIEVHWPKYLAVVAFGVAIAYLINDKGMDNIFNSLPAALLFSAITYFGASKFRKSLNNMHELRTGKNRSIYYKLGGLVGFGYFVYSNFISSSIIMGVDVGIASVFSDGIQAEDFGAIVRLLLQCAAYIVIGGLTFDAIGKRLFGGNV